MSAIATVATVSPMLARSLLLALIVLAATSCCEHEVQSKHVSPSEKQMLVVSRAASQCGSFEPAAALPVLAQLIAQVG